MSYFFTLQSSSPGNIVAAAPISFNRSSLSGRLATRLVRKPKQNLHTIDFIYMRVHASDAYLMHALLCQYFLCDIMQGGWTFWETEVGFPSEVYDLCQSRCNQACSYCFSPQACSADQRNCSDNL